MNVLTAIDYKTLNSNVKTIMASLLYTQAEDNGRNGQTNNITDMSFDQVTVQDMYGNRCVSNRGFYVKIHFSVRS